MIRKIRKGIFETNSSSSHSISLSRKESINDILSPNTKDNNKYLYDFGESGDYGWQFQDYCLVQTKLDYLMVDLYYEYEDIESIKNSDEFKNLKEVIKDVCDLELEVINTTPFDKWNPIRGYIDHQSVGTAIELCSDKNDLINYLFNTKSVLHIGNDNV